MEEESKEEKVEERNFFDQPTALRSKSSPNRTVLVAGIIIVLLLLGLGGWFILRGKGESALTSPTPTPFIEVTVPSPTPAISPSVDKSQIAIEVLNGTGIAGEAAFLKEKFEALGYSKISTGNASSQDNKKTVVSFASSLGEEVKSEIENELKRLYQDVSIGTSPGASADVRIVSGLRKGATPKPTSASSPTPTATPKPTATSSPTPTP